MPRKVNDLTGQTFGDLEVLERAGSTSRGAALWRCLCHRCGGEAILKGYCLTANRSPKKDCGCRKREQLADLSGQTFGALEVIRRTGSYPSGDKAYLCRCAICGGEKVFPSGAIRQSFKSCGCRHYETDRMTQMSALGKAAAIVDGVNINSVYKKEATKISKTGVRGVFPESGRPGQYRASCQVHGEVWVKTGFTSIESAKKARDAAQAKLLDKYKVKDPEEKNDEDPK